MPLQSIVTSVLPHILSPQNLSFPLPGSGTGIQLRAVVPVQIVVVVLDVVVVDVVEVVVDPGTQQQSAGYSVQSKQLEQ
jgi:hypothetical protein